MTTKTKGASRGSKTAGRKGRKSAGRKGGHSKSKRAQAQDEQEPSPAEIMKAMPPKNLMPGVTRYMKAIEKMERKAKANDKRAKSTKGPKEPVVDLKTMKVIRD